MLTRCLAVYSAVMTTLLAVGTLYAPANAAPKRQEIDEVTVQPERTRGGWDPATGDCKRARMPGVIMRGKEAAVDERAGGRTRVWLVNRFFQWRDIDGRP